MIEASELLRSYLQGIRRLTGADSVSLFVPAPLSGLSQPLLLHDGDGPPLPEHADLDAAVESTVLCTARLEEASPDELGLLPSEDAAAALVALPSVRALWTLSLGPEAGGQQPPRHPNRRRSDLRSRAAGPPGAWLGLRLPPGRGSLLERLVDRDPPQRMRSAADPAGWWDWLFALGGALASHTSQVSAMLKDPVTGLPDRAGFQAILVEEIEKARRRRRPLCLLFINPDEFAVVNERFGREAGDRIVREISGRIRTALRSSDPVSRYGGVIFGAVLAETPLEEARGVADKVMAHLTEGAFLDGAVRLGFSIGIAICEPGDETLTQPLELIRRADQALNAAKRLGGGMAIDWEQRSRAEETGNFDRMSGIFTGNMTKDYRNMVLLWDTIDVIAADPEFAALAGHMVERLYTTFKPDRVGIYGRDDDGNLKLVKGITRQRGDASRQPRTETLETTAEQRELLGLAIAESQPRSAAFDDGRTGYAVPLMTSQESLGCLYLDGDDDTLAVDSSDLVFLRALASQLAVALDRARLAELEAKRTEREKRKLRAELNELRQALQQAKLVYRSPEIDGLVATARRVAPTDATVLITGPSGTGKELLARTVHELSPRSEQPFVIVDCGAISTTLIESELFGHEKGAYTGAQQRRQGRLAEANHGTVLLDEIGELPLEVQSKLLRFVQEKQFTTVGGTRPRRVDVRILAATNRDLASEVAAGRFREDLYYRLNVVRLDVPPLRDRPDDILHLARHFLETFTVQYHKNIRQLDSEAERHLLAHGWPGNVRELQNRMMQAVILCEGDEIGPAELGLPAEREAGGATEPVAASVPRTGPRAAAAAPEAAAAERRRPSYAELKEQVRRALARQIEGASEAHSGIPLPLGKWLSDDLILEADLAAGGVARRGSAIVGIPETTFRRRLQRAADQERTGLAPRSGTWSEVRSLLGEVVRCSGIEERNLIESLEEVLLGEILERYPTEVRIGSALLGVTPPTYRRRVARLSRAT